MGVLVTCWSYDSRLNYEHQPKHAGKYTMSPWILCFLLKGVSYTTHGKTPFVVPTSNGGNSPPTPSIQKFPHIAASKINGIWTDRAEVILGDSGNLKMEPLNPGCFTGILIMAYYNPYVTG